jgi:hypothetical protein
MPHEPENKDDWRPLSNPRFAQGALWVTVGLVGWIILMMFALEIRLGEDAHGGILLVLPFVVTFLAVALGFTLVIPKTFPVARSTVSVVFLLIALFFAVVYTWGILFWS